MTGNTISATGFEAQYASLRSDLLDACDRVLGSAWYVLGTEVDAFESEFAAWVGGGSCVAVASGTDALELALRAHDIGTGHEVIVPTNALPTAYGVAATGADLRFADVRHLDLNIDPDSVRALLTPRTRAVIAVHLYGHPADVPALRAMLADAGRADVLVIEDCAQAHGAAIDGVSVGLHGDIAAFSFYPTKNLGAFGDGGSVLTADAGVAARVKRLRMYGERQRYVSDEIGTNSRMDELQAALLRVKLAHLDDWIARRRDVASRYDALLVDEVVRPPDRGGRFAHGRHLYPVQVHRRDEVLAALAADGVPAAIHYPVGLHDQKAFAHFTQGELPVATEVASRLLSLPMHPWLSDADVTATAHAVNDVVRSCMASA